MLLRYTISPVTVQGMPQTIKLVFMTLNKSPSVTLSFIFISLIIWDCIPITLSSSTLNPPLLYFNLIVTCPDWLYHCHINLPKCLHSLRLFALCWDKSYPYPSHLLNLYWTLGRVYTHILLLTAWLGHLPIGQHHPLYTIYSMRTRLSWSLRHHCHCLQVGQGGRTTMRQSQQWCEDCSIVVPVSSPSLSSGKTKVEGEGEGGVRVRVRQKWQWCEDHGIMVLLLLLPPSSGETRGEGKASVRMSKGGAGMRARWPGWLRQQVVPMSSSSGNTRCKGKARCRCESEGNDNSNDNMTTTLSQLSCHCHHCHCWARRPGEVRVGAMRVKATRAEVARVIVVTMMMTWQPCCHSYCVIVVIRWDEGEGPEEG